MTGSTQIQMVQGTHDGMGQRLGTHKNQCHMSKSHTDHEILSPGEQSGSGSMQDREKDCGEPEARWEELVLGNKMRLPSMAISFTVSLWHPPNSCPSRTSRV